MLDIKTEKNGGVMNMTLKGVLDTTSAGDLNDALLGPIAEINEIHIDFAELEYLTSAGLRVILEAQQEMDDKDGEMTIKNVNDDIMEIFDITGFIDVLTIEE